MQTSDHAELERLRSKVLSTRAATVAWRELLIESLGNRLCGSGGGPTPEQIQTLASLEEAEQQAVERYLMFLATASLHPDRRPC
ncbi:MULTISPECIES: hypothetical protein [unclassified Variovorax]|uniref:hypothetical protein n=1 Tax=unclassified Variovorax TaxID=663243 RepID=UPI00076C72D7|nr:MULTISPECIES: hypothetical protein [unclassified Variovorax]KWT65711.1 hypothetical protein APY03_7338 [Variovorax sp. WDL1]PNG56738.1 hypothetical protein CHC07_03161 [Variovorax sp. B4]PNG58162.1 hypothetical protein CHC06_03164 [Variovorax sp. B2]VTV09331.1 hypothetical protein WDL1CHR_00461 [Variovorax sp. WDL1]